MMHLIFFQERNSIRDLWHVLERFMRSNDKEISWWYLRTYIELVREYVYEVILMKEFKRNTLNTSLTRPLSSEKTLSNQSTPIFEVWSPQVQRKLDWSWFKVGLSLDLELLGEVLSYVHDRLNLDSI